MRDFMIITCNRLLISVTFTLIFYVTSAASYPQTLPMTKVGRLASSQGRWRPRRFILFRAALTLVGTFKKSVRISGTRTWNLNFLSQMKEITCLTLLWLPTPFCS